MSKRFEVTICDLKDAEYSNSLLAKRSNNRSYDRRILKFGYGKALLARVLHRRSNQVAFNAI